MKLNYDLDELEKESLTSIENLLGEAGKLFSNLDRTLQDEILNQHNETASLNHCLYWGLQAIEEINEEISKGEETYFCPVCQKQSELKDACDNVKCEER